MKTLINIIEATTYILVAIVILTGLWVGFDNGFTTDEPNENPPKELVSKTDSLKAVVSDLEAKIEILNRYLVQKNLEYIDACDLKTKH